MRSIKQFFAKNTRLMRSQRNSEVGIEKIDCAANDFRVIELSTSDEEGGRYDQARDFSVSANSSFGLEMTNVEDDSRIYERDRGIQMPNTAEQKFALSYNRDNSDQSTANLHQSAENAKVERQYQSYDRR